MLSSELERSITQSWLKLRKKILSNPHELRRRLARRRGVLLSRPPRPWCLALRASDRRITPAHCIITPEHAMDLDHPLHPYEPIEHEVTIQTHAIRRYCGPVSFSREDAADVAKMLGVSPARLAYARSQGTFEERYIKGLGGKRGRPIPLLSPRGQLLDPGHANKFSRPHPVWGSVWEFLCRMVPRDFEQTVIRRPFFRHFGKTRTTGVSPVSSNRTTGILPVSSRRKLPIPPDQHYKDESQLLGYRWLCPSCKKECRTIYYPLPVTTLFDSWFTDPAIQKKLTDADLLHDPPPTFACAKCHRVKHFSTIDAGFWNQYISYLTGGLLFGREVAKPPSFQPQRKYTRTRRLGYEAPIRRKVLTRLRLGWSPFKIAHDLRMKLNSVQRHIYKICREENVPNVHALAKKLNFKPPPPNQLERSAARRAQVQEMLLENSTQKEICEKLSIDRGLLCSDTRKIYRAHNIKAFGYRARRALAAKLGLPFHTKWDALREQVATLRSQKLTHQQIAQDLNLPLKTVSYLSSKRGQNAHGACSVGLSPKESSPMASVGPPSTETP